MADMTQSLSAAVRAYSDAQRARRGSGAGADDESSGAAGVKAGGGGFADLVKGALKQAVETGRTSESQSMAAISDRADLNQVVTAVAEAEVTLQTVVAVRDKVIEAYREILRMPI